MGMPVIDIIFMVIIAISALRCAAHGFISEVLSMAALILGILSSILFFRQGAVFVRAQFMPEVQVVPELIAFAAIFLIVFIAIKIIEMTLRSIIEGVRLGGLDRLLGFFFGLVEGIVIVCLLLFLISIQPLFDPKQIIEESFFAKILMPLIFGNAKEIIESIILPEVPEGAGADV